MPIGLIVVLSLVTLVVLFWVLWQTCVIQPIYWMSKLGTWEAYYKGDWSPDGNSYQAKLSKGTIHWGFNHKTRHEFIIFNGNDVDVYNWQIQNWRPRVAIWGPRLWLFRIRAKEMPSHLTEQEINRMGGNDLGKLPPEHPMRLKLEQEMSNTVRHHVALARNQVEPQWASQRESAIFLLRNSLKVKPWEWQSSFAAWITRRGTLLGVEECYRLGKAACDELGFTFEEANLLYQELKNSKTETEEHLAA